MITLILAAALLWSPVTWPLGPWYAVAETAPAVQPAGCCVVVGGDGPWTWTVHPRERHGDVWIDGEQVRYTYLLPRVER